MRRAVVLPALLLAATTAAEDKPGAKLGSMRAEEASALAREIAPRVEELRGSKFKAPVPVKIVDAATARAHFKARMAKLSPEQQMRREAAAYAQLGLLPKGYDLVAALFDVLEEQAGGYYDPESRTFFVLSDMPRGMAPVLMAHELTHALDDQHYDIDARLVKARGDEDRETGFSAVVEGSGTLVMSVFMMREIGAGRMKPDVMLEFQHTEAGKAKKLNRAPEVVRRSLVAPYALGQAFLLRGDLARARSGVNAADVDRAFRDPPVSSEQLLHPEKYWDERRRDLPRAVRLPDLCATLGASWSLQFQGVLGELMIAVLTGSPSIDVMSPDAGIPARWTNAAATGWGGDRLHYCAGPQGQAVTLLATLWDSLTDAKEFAAALPPGPGRKVLQQDAAVVVVAGDRPDAAVALARRALESILPAPAAGPRKSRKTSGAGGRPLARSR